jgi:hypothetical protein
MRAEHGHLCTYAPKHLEGTTKLLPPLHFVVLGLELRAFTLSHSTSPVFVKDLLR